MRDRQDMNCNSLDDAGLWYGISQIMAPHSGTTHTTTAKQKFTNFCCLRHHATVYFNSNEGQSMQSLTNLCGSRLAEDVPEPQCLIPCPCYYSLPVWRHGLTMHKVQVLTRETSGKHALGEGQTTQQKYLCYIRFREDRCHMLLSCKAVGYTPGKEPCMNALSVWLSAPGMGTSKQGSGSVSNHVCWPANRQGGTAAVSKSKHH